jgi:hypothetical protein
MRIDIDLKIDFQKFQFDTLQKLINLPFKKIVLLKYGSHERDMKKFIDTSSADLISHWDHYLSILIKGKNQLFFSLDTSRSGQIYGGGGGDFAEKSMDLVLKDLILIMNTLNENGALIFAAINSQELHDQRHKVTTKFESGGSAYGWEGSSIHDFLDLLPGVTWYTFFGAHYVQCLGANKLQNIDNITYINSENGAIAFHHKKSINELLLSDLEAVEAQIEPQYFYSKKRDRNKLCHPKGFKAYLLSLETEFNRKYPQH